ncbi:aminotransferase class I/II-fold pyridoxal phosphate-dependent enzyme [Fulvivirga maritima]|uniref:pyridoxal phosphate-dependent aminotransferase n=1 Tax=Fulvivirga maritima TaxID=2904247 RepID=UPI001F25E4B5|nr:aminotransferase class I/II-fold pyridoxal phosphate-dependent enzyme [Fulvivirga maritima]UII26669.1 aminotransferase class I/II-fold pyridoxal phosphate-dependent enzyme [Fulvivirga maritima]
MIISTADRLGQVKEYYFSKKLAEVRKMQSEGKDVLNLAIGSPDLPPAEAVLNKASEEIFKPVNHGYQSYTGLPELREAMSQWIDRVFEVNLDATTEILPLIGSKEGITHISLTFLNPGDQVLVPELCYPAYGAVAEMCGAEVIRFPLLQDNGWQPDWQFLEQLDYSKIKLLWLNYPHMPTGQPADVDTLTRFVQLAREKQVLLCHDNPYSMILPSGKPLSIFSVPGAKEVALELNSMSKSFNMAGWRIGWVAGAQEYIQAILKIKSNVDSGMFKPMMLAAVEALKLGDEWFDSINEVYAQRRVKAQAIMDKLGCTYSADQQGMFVWAQIPDEVNSAEDLVERLLHENHVFITPGFIFGDKGKKYVRISLCSDVEVYEKALKRL